MTAQPSGMLQHYSLDSIATARLHESALAEWSLQSVIEVVDQQVRDDPVPKGYLHDAQTSASRLISFQHRTAKFVIVLQAFVTRP